MNENYVLIVDDRGNLLGHGQRDGATFTGVLKGESFSVSRESLGSYVARKAGDKARLCFVHEPLWRMGTVIL